MRQLKLRKKTSTGVITSYKTFYTSLEKIAFYIDHEAKIAHQLSHEEDNMDSGIIIALIGAVIGAAATLGTVFLTYFLDKRKEHMSDKDIFKAWQGAFDRGAFRGPWRWTVSDVPSFETAIKDVLNAVNTGTMKNQQGRGKTSLKKQELFSEMDEVTGRLYAILVFVRQFNKLNEEIVTSDTEFYKPWPVSKRSSQEFEKAFQEHRQAKDELEKSQKRITEAVDQQRDEIIEILNKIWVTFNIRPLAKPTESKDYTSDSTV
jgi:hypothetical protein